jgi:hypothetical protein
MAKQLTLTLPQSKDDAMLALRATGLIMLGATTDGVIKLGDKLACLHGTNMIELANDLEPNVAHRFHATVNEYSTPPNRTQVSISALKAILDAREQALQAVPS